MRLIELQKYGEYSVIVRQDTNGNPIVIEPFVVACGANKDKDGEVIDWDFGHYFNDLFEAVNYARTKTETYHPNFHRLCEIASKAVDGLVMDDEDMAYEYFANEMEIDSHEADYFGINKELLESYK